MNSDAPTLLLVEDNEDDIFIFTRAYKKAQLTYRVQVVSDGQMAVDYLAGEGAFADRTKYPFPSLVLLDLKLSLMPGLEVLQLLRSRISSAHLCVVVLTSSAEHRDIVRARELGAQAFLVKPPTPRMLADAVDLAGRWSTGDGGTGRPRINGDMFAKDVEG